MAVVRAYGQRQVTTRPIAGVKNTLTPQSAFTPVAAAGMRLVGDIMQRRADFIDQTAAIETHNQLATWRQEKLNEALQTTGKDAFDLPDTLTQQFEEYAGTVQQGLQNSRQRMQFERQKAEQLESLRSALFAHATRQRTQFFAEQADAAVKLATSDAVANADNPTRIADELARGEGVIRERLKGQAPETVQQQVLAFQTNVHTGVIGRLLDNEKDGMARDYYEAAKDQIAGDQRARVEKAIAAGTLRGEAQRQSDAIMAGSTSMTAALEQARAIEDPQLRDEVQNRVEHEWALRKQAQRESVENIMVTAANLIDKGGLRAVPTSLWSQLEPGQRTSLESYAKRNQVGGDAEGKTDLATYYGLMQSASTEPDKFAQTNLLMYLGKLGKTEFKQLTELQNALRKGDTSRADATIESFTTKDQVFTDILAEHAIKKDSPQALTLRRALDKQVEQAQIASGGKKLTHTEIRELGDQLVGTVVLERGGWTNIFPGGKPFFDQAKPVADLTVADIPPAEKRAVQAALQKAGRPVTDATVLDWYLRAKRKAGDIK